MFLKIVALPAWWGRWRTCRCPSQGGRTAPLRCSLRRHRWSPAECKSQSMYVNGKMCWWERNLFDFPPEKGQRGRHNDDQGTFHHSGQLLACKPRRTFTLISDVDLTSQMCLMYIQRIWKVIHSPRPPYHPAEEASDSVRGCSAKADPNGFRPKVVLRLGQFCWRGKVKVKERKEKVITNKPPEM